MKTERYDHLLFIELVFIISAINGLVIGGMDGDCTIHNPTMICEHEIPIAVPDNITGIIIKDYSRGRINYGSFVHESWSSVQTLDITVNDKVGFRLNDNNFVSLKRLKQLGIHSPFYKFNNQTNVFGGLSSLRTLNLSSCFYIDATAVISLLTPLRHLDTLDLKQIATSGNRFMIFDKAFVKVIKRTKIRKLSLSGCNIVVKGPLHVTNMSNLYDVDFSNISITKQTNVLINNNTLDALFPKVKILDMSLLQSRFIDIDYAFLKNYIYDKCPYNENGLLKFILRLEHLKINRVFLTELRANNSFIDLIQCTVNLRTLQIRSNHIHYLNLTVKWPEVLFLYHIDLSSNGIEFLSPSCLGSVRTLEILNLSGNKLHLMESLMVFRYLFINHKKLGLLNLSNNGLSSLPFTIFSYNFDMHTLDLSHNNLRSISFDLKNLIKLQYLNLRQNKIHYIDSPDLDSLHAFISYSSKNLKIHFEYNPIVCKCRSLPFIKWLHEMMIMNNGNNENLNCLFKEEENVFIDKSVIEEVEFSCIRPTIIIASMSTVFVILFSVSIVISFLVYKKRQEKKKRKRRNFLQEFKLGKVEEKYLCFASYSSDDDDLEIKQVIARIKESLHELIQTDREILCEGNRNFQLGFPIVDEIIRCIVESCVGIFFVTRNFCQSIWCQMELRETYELNKPIILIFKDEIDEKNMPPLMLRIFKQFTRAKIIIMGDGQIQMTPDFNQLSNSILILASARFNDNNA